MTRSHIGKTIYISAALPASNDSTGFEALSWTKVNGLQTLPQLGVTNASIAVPDLQTGFTTTLKGPATGVASQATFRDVASDTGQALCKTIAADDLGECSVKIGTGSGTANALASGDPVQYAQGYLSDYQENQGTDTTHEGFTVTFQQNDTTVDATEPA